MLRLRTTMALSVLALAIGIAGTQWLSDQGAGDTVVSPVALANTRTRIVPHRHRSRPMARLVPVPSESPRVGRSFLATAVAHSAPAMTPAPAPELIPLAMPSEHGTPYDELRGHLDGRVVVHVNVDGHGDVTRASVAQSSGDAVLDAHALRSVRGWRFAVPVDRPSGLSADLPMQFSSRDGPLASTR
jgi:protein TonB